MIMWDWTGGHDLMSGKHNSAESTAECLHPGTDGRPEDVKFW